jgi:hypothetical protein
METSTASRATHSRTVNDYIQGKKRILKESSLKTTPHNSHHSKLWSTGVLSSSTRAERRLCASGEIRLRGVQRLLGTGRGRRGKSIRRSCIVLRYIYRESSWVIRVLEDHKSFCQCIVNRKPHIRPGHRGGNRDISACVARVHSANHRFLVGCERLSVGASCGLGR